MQLALGPWAGSFKLMAISLLGSANGINIYNGRSLTYAAARQGQIFKDIGELGAQSRAPYVAYLLQGVLCILLLLQSSNVVRAQQLKQSYGVIFPIVTDHTRSVAFDLCVSLIVICFCL